MMVNRLQISRRVVLWLALITITAFMLYLGDTRYNNIDKNGIDYYLIESPKSCSLNKTCGLRKFSKEQEWTVQLIRPNTEKNYTVILNKISSATKVVFRLIENNASQTEKGVVSSEIKGQNLTQLKSTRWQLKNINIRTGQANIKYILYVFTADAIYEFHQAVSLQ